MFLQDLQAFFMSTFLTCAALSFLMATVAGIVMTARKYAQERIDALQVRNADAAPALDPLETCRAVVIEMPDGDILVGCPSEDGKD